MPVDFQVAMAAVLTGAAIKSAALILIAWALAVLLRRKSAALRHQMWLLALTGSLVLPALILLIPGWRVLPAWLAGVPKISPAPNATSTDRPAVFADDRPARVGAADPADAAGPKDREPDPTFTEVLPAAAPQAVQAPASMAGSVTSRNGIAVPRWLLHWLCAGWGFGSGLLVLRSLAGMFSLHILASKATRVDQGPLALAMDRAYRDMDFSRPVVLLRSGRRETPMTWGVLFPKILLPDNSVDWSEPRQRLALAHELAHVRRRDALAQLLGQLACALYWFNPLVWLAFGQLRKEQEAAADDLVLRGGGDGHEYARLLLHVATTLRRREFAGAVAMARRYALEGRIRALLDPTRDRRPMTLPRAVAATMLGVLLIVPAAGLTAQTRPAETPARPASVPAPVAVRDADAHPGVHAYSYAGHVLSPEGKPVIGAEVVLNGSTEIDVWGEVAATKAGPDGGFAFHDIRLVTRGGTPTFTVLAPGFGITGVTASPWDDNRVNLAPATSVRITFLGPDGKPIAGLRVLPMGTMGHGSQGTSTGAVSFRGRLGEQLSRRTDPDGTCAFSGMPQNAELRLSVDDVRFAQLADSGDGVVSLGDRPETPAKTIRVRRGAAVSGAVSYGPSGKPAAGVRVLAQSLDRGVNGGRGDATTNERGEYFLRQLSPGVYNILLDHNLLLSSRWTAVARRGVRLAEGQDVPGQDLTLISGAVITGRVLRADSRQGVADASILAHGPSHPADTSMSMYTYTSPDGTYTLRAAPGTQHIRFDDPPDGYRGRAERDVTVADGQTMSVDLELQRLPGKPVAGRAVGPDGRPVEGAIVNGEPGPGPRDFFDRSPQQLTDELGRFHFEAITAGTLFRAGRGTLATTRPIAVNGGENNVTLLLTPTQPVTVEGLVTGADGKPLRGARLRVTVVRRGSYLVLSSSRPAEVTDDKGRYVIRGLSSGDQYALGVDADGYGVSGTILALEPGRETVEVAPIRLKPETSSVAGIVMDDAGRPLGGVQVQINGSETALRTAVTGNDGKFSFGVVEGAQVALSARAADGKSLGSSRVKAGTGDVRLAPPPVPAGTKASPEQAAAVIAVAKTFFEAMAKGDAQAAKGLYTGDSINDLDAALDEAMAYRSLQDAMATKFGADARRDSPKCGAARALAQLEHVNDVLVEGDRATLGAPGRASGRMAFVNSGGWKITRLPGAGPELVKSLAKSSQIARALAAEVTAGGIKTTDELSAAYRQRMEQDRDP